MPRLACFKCGRTIWATAPVAMLFVEERRCPRCGADMKDDRRTYDRRQFDRRQMPTGPLPMDGERRLDDRRKARRRRVSN